MIRSCKCEVQGATGLDEVYVHYLGMGYER